MEEKAYDRRLTKNNEFHVQLQSNYYLFFVIFYGA